MNDVRLRGRLVCADAHDAGLVSELLPAHIELSRAEPGCLSFAVLRTDDPLVWTVEERFVDSDAFRAHQARTAGSEWGRRTVGVARDYEVIGYETITIVAPPREAPEVIAAMHRAFAEFSATGQPSGALRETAETLRAEMADGVRAGIARIDGRAVASVKHHPADDGTLYFSRLGVVPEARGRGIGGRIVSALRERASTEGLDGLSCLVRADETGNIALYERLGMRVVSRGRKQSRTGAVLDVVAMRDA